MTIRFRKKASALVTTLFVVVVLSTIVMAFMTSMSLERKIAGSVKNKYQAELAAEAGMQDFLLRLGNIKIDGPYSTFYVLGPNTNPYLFLGKRIFSSNGTTTKRIPLFSTGLTNFSDLTNFSAPFLSGNSITIQDIDRSGSGISRTLTLSNDIWCDINKTNAQFSSGLVGLRNTFTNTNSIPTLSANWVYIKNSAGKVIGRYAYWADDECSKLDIRYAGQSANTSGDHSRSNGSSFSELALTPLNNAPKPPPLGNLTAGNLGNLLAFTNNTVQALPFTLKNLKNPIASAGNLSESQWQAIKPFVTLYSRHDDRSLDGKRRINLNALVTSTTDANQIANQTITIRDAITNNLPKFGERFYSVANGTATTPTADHQKAYATRIAANIRDFIDADNNATIINSNGEAYAGNDPLFANLGAPKDMDDEMLPMALGKEGGLYLSEYLRIIRVIEPVVPQLDTTTEVKVRFRFAHYVELANISQKTVNYNDLGNNPYLIISGRSHVTWMNAAKAEPYRFSDIKINLPDSLSVEPGQFVYLTTDGPPWSGNQTSFLGDSSKRYVISYSDKDEPGKWRLVNTTGNSPLADKMAGYSEVFEDYETLTKVEDTTEKKYAVYIDAASDTTYTDQTESIILANDSGIIDCAFRIYTNLRRSLCYGDKNPLWFSTYLNDSESSTDKAAPSGDSSARYTRGDMRSNMEIGSMLKNTTALGWKNGEVRYGGNLESNENITLGYLNYRYSNMFSLTGVARWQQGLYEITSDPAGNAYHKNTNITSLAELGYIYDPVRYDIEGYRSMGATLRMGQSDSPTNNRATNSAADYQNWLGGRGNDSATNTDYGKNAFLLMDIFRTDTNISGRINPNSIVRDGLGIVLQSALTNFVYEIQSTNGASSLLGNRTLNPTNTVAAIRRFATNSANGFLLSVGDLSRIPAFWGNANAVTNIVPNMRMSDASDAGKEEFLRRTANLLTTQSLAYSVYIIGQTGEIQTKSGTETFVPNATTITENVIQLEPIYPSTTSQTPVAPSNWKTLNPKSISY